MPEGLLLVLLALACALAGGAIGHSLGRRRDIATEMRLIESEARTDAILEAAVDAVITIDERGRIESFNRAAERMFGYDSSEVMGRNVSMLMPEPDRSAHDGYLRNYMRTGDARVIGKGREVTGMRKDLSTFPMDLAVGEARMGGRRIFAGIVRDISERKRTEGRLRESEARTRAILDAAVDGVVTIDEKGIIQSANPAAERIFGWRASEIVGRNVSMLMPEPYRSQHDTYLANYLRTGQARIIGIGREVEGQRKDGHTFPMELAVGEGNIAGRRIFAGTIRDLTDRKVVEERLRAADERFRMLVEGVRDYAILTLSPDGLVTSWNLGAERLYGWPADEILGHSAGRFFPDHGERDMEAVLSAARRAGRHDSEGWRLRADGGRFWSHAVVTALRDDAGVLTGFASISQDMTAHKQAEDDLRRAKAVAEHSREVAEKARVEAERANIAKTKFLAAASHDLRQPVQAIFFFASVLGHKLRNHPAESVVEDLQRALDGLNILLDSLLDVSRLDAGIVAPKEVDFSLAPLLERVAGDFAPLARDKSLDFRVVHCGAVVRSDPALLARILQNLVSNAIRYTETGRILLGCRRRGGRVCVEVWDTGIGIPPDRRDEIFEEFTQLGNPERDRSQGLGLGLAIVDRLARLLGHRIEVDSAPGRGSRFAVSLPLGKAARPSRAAAAAAPRPHPDGTGETVLLIDDESIVLKGLSMVLQGWGYEVLAATSEEEALAILADIPRPPSLILADYRLREGRTGTEAVAHIRDLYHTAIPSIIITGDTAPERLREAEASGLSILHKPVQPPELRQLLHEAMSRSSTESIH